MKIAVMDDATLLGFLGKRHKDVIANIAAVPEFELKGDYTPETLVPVVKTLTALVKDVNAQEGVKKAATSLLIKLDTLAEVEETPTDALAKSLLDLKGALEKRGARNSASDMQLIQHAHDTICKLGAGCIPPVPAKGKDVMSLPPGSSQKADGVHKESDVMGTAVKKDAITSEGNARGASVTSPSMPAESSNGKNDDVTADDGATKGKPRFGEDDADGDDDATKAKKGKARKAAQDAWNKEMGKSDGKTIALTEEQLEALITKALKASKEGDGVIPRVAPALLQVGKDGTVQKMESVTDQIDTLKKSVKKHNKDEMGSFAASGDNDTCTLIKAIHKNRIMVPEAELQALGLLAK